MILMTRSIHSTFISNVVVIVQKRLFIGRPNFARMMISENLHDKVFVDIIVLGR